MRDKLEKYLLIKSQFPNQAGELQRIFASQKRVIKSLGNPKDSKVKDLMLLTSEAQDVTNKLIEWVYQVMQGVCQDAELIDATKARNTIELLNEEMLRLRTEVNVMTGADR